MNRDRLAFTAGGVAMVVAFSWLAFGSLSPVGVREAGGDWWIVWLASVWVVGCFTVNVLAQLPDILCNGAEISGGSTREPFDPWSRRLECSAPPEQRRHVAPVSGHCCNAHPDVFDPGCTDCRLMEAQTELAELRVKLVEKERMVEKLIAVRSSLRRQVADQTDVQA